MRSMQRKFGLSLALGTWLLLAGSSISKEKKEEHRLKTRDYVELAITYYPSKAGKQAVPVVMLHDFKETRNVFNNLASNLQDPNEGESYAVITVDLRGHGESTVQQAPNGQTRDLDASRLRPADFQLMVTQDMEAVRRFLVKKNDEGDLNLNALTLVGAGMGANVATYWAAKDWATPRLATRKQGQDVKALVLASPQWSYRGLPLLQPLRQQGLLSDVSFLLVYGSQQSKAKRDANVIMKNLKRDHPAPPPDRAKEEKDLFEIPIETKLQGTKLLTSSESDMLSTIEQFLDLRVSRQSFPWEGRKE